MKYEPILWDIETTGLNPMAQHWWNGQLAAQVTAIGLVKLDGWRDAEGLDDYDKEIKVLWDGDEYRLLNVFKDRLEDIVHGIRESGKEPFIVGWNSRNFDHPYIAARYGRKRLENQYINHSLKRLDMMRPLGDDEVIEKRHPKQDEYAEALGFEVYDELDGSDMPKAFEREQWDKIDQHVRADVDVMADIFVERAEACYEELYNHYDDIEGEHPKFIQEGEY